MKIACFTGHRPHKFLFSYNEHHPTCVVLKKVLYREICGAIVRGYTRFISGMALGVDTWAAECVIEAKKHFSHVSLSAYLPCKGQEKRWNVRSRERYYAICSQADEVRELAPAYYPGCMLERDYAMVDNSNLLIAVYNGTMGGTQHTFDYATSQNCAIIWIQPSDFSVRVVGEIP